MPFAVFRKHQRKLMAIFAILAMFAFVVGDSLPSWIGGRGGRGGSGSDPVVAKLKWKTLHYSDLEPMRLQRQRANYFLSAVSQGTPQYAQFFGGSSTQELVDAVILEHEADALGMPVSVEMANRWLQQVTQGMINPRLLEEIYRRSNLSNQVTDEQLLIDIANQVRIREVETLPLRTAGQMPTAEVTPLDVYSAYRDQNEKVSAFAVPVRVEEFVGKVGEPSESEIETLYGQSKDVLPNPDSPSPGFKVPQKVKFEMITADVPALADTIRPKLTEDELRAAYKARTSEFPAPPGELPLSIFAGAPDLTPHDAFPEVRDRVASTLAEERAREEINGKIDEIKNNTMREFEDKYYDVETAEGTTAPKASKPGPGDLLKQAGAKAGLTYETTPLVPATAPDQFGPIGQSRIGTVTSFDATRFLDLAFARKTLLYDPLELTDDRGRRYLAWKIEDIAPRVPPLSEVRAEVVAALKTAKARPLAEAEAKTIARAAEKAGGGAKIKDVAGQRPVITTEPRAKLVPATMVGMSSFGQPRPADIPEIPQAGDLLRNALFNLQSNTATTAPDRPIKVYYALTLKDREKADFEKLYAFGMGTFMLQEVSQDAIARRLQEWRQTLRSRAGLPADWAPPASDRNGDEVADSR